MQYRPYSRRGYTHEGGFVMVKGVAIRMLGLRNFGGLWSSGGGGGSDSRSGSRSCVRIVIACLSQIFNLVSRAVDEGAGAKFTTERDVSCGAKVKDLQHTC